MYSRGYLIIAERTKEEAARASAASRRMQIGWRYGSGIDDSAERDFIVPIPP